MGQETSDIEKRLAEHAAENRPKTAAELNNLGELHALMKRGLPEYIDKNGFLDARKLAIEMQITYQALYAIFRRGTIQRRRIETACFLSEKTKKKNRPAVMTDKDGKEVPWRPLVLDDFWPFMG